MNAGNGYNFESSAPFSNNDPFGLAPEYVIYGPSSRWPAGLIPGIPDPGLTPDTPSGMGVSGHGFTGPTWSEVKTEVQYTITEETVNEGDWYPVLGTSGSTVLRNLNVTTVVSWSQEARNVKRLYRIEPTHE